METQPRTDSLKVGGIIGMNLESWTLFGRLFNGVIDR